MPGCLPFLPLIGKKAIRGKGGIALNHSPVRTRQEHCRKQIIASMSDAVVIALCAWLLREFLPRQFCSAFRIQSNGPRFCIFSLRFPWLPSGIERDCQLSWCEFALSRQFISRFTYFNSVHGLAVESFRFRRALLKVPMEGYA